MCLEALERPTAGDHDVRDDALPALLVRLAYDHRVGDLARGVQDAQNLVRSHPVSHGLDDSILPPHEVEEPLRVAADQVPRVHDALGVRRAGRAQRVGAKHARGELGILPVAQGDRWPTVYQLADLAGGRQRTILLQHVRLAAGDGTTHRVGPAVQLLGWEVRAAHRFGQAVHQVQARVRLGAAQRCYGVRREVAAGVGHDPERRERSIDESGKAQQPVPERRHGSQHCDALRPHSFDHLLRERGSLDDERGPGANGA